MSGFKLISLSTPCVELQDQIAEMEMEMMMKGRMKEWKRSNLTAINQLKDNYIYYTERTMKE